MFVSKTCMFIYLFLFAIKYDIFVDNFKDKNVKLWLQTWKRDRSVINYLPLLGIKKIFTSPHPGFDSYVWIGEYPPCIVQALIQDSIFVSFDWIKVLFSYKKRRRYLQVDGNNNMLWIIIDNSNLKQWFPSQISNSRA